MDDNFAEIPPNAARVMEVANANAVVGPLQRLEGRVIIPLASVSAGYGFGYGFGRDRRTHIGSAPKETAGGGGGGGGARARPVAVLELTASEFRVHQVVDSTRITLASLALAGWALFWITRTIRAFRHR